MRHPIRIGVVLLTLATLTRPSRADEGMWLPDKLPEDQLKQKYNFEPTREWLEHVMQASVRFGEGGSASFVSPDGLVMTNHHVGSEAVQSLSTSDRDYMRDGFYARTRDEEVKCPGLDLNVLVKIEPITDRLNAAVKPKMDAAEAAAARKQAMSEIETEAKATGLTPEIVTLYQGGRYDLYLYKRYTDVRLVMAPELGAAFFGGDVDNFEFPRHCLDVSFFRAYESGKPARTEHYLTWSDSGPTPGEVLFVSGHPGRTQRMHTMAHLRFVRDVWIPLVLNSYNQREVALIQFASKSDEHRRIALEDLLYIQNGRKAFGGMLAGLLDAGLMERKSKEEFALREFVDENDKRRKDVGEAWDRLEKALADSRAYYPEYFLLENRRTKLCRLHDIASKLVRAADERKKPDGERLEEYREANLPTLELDLFSAAPIHDELEQLRFEDGLMRLGRILGGGHPAVEKAFGGQDAQTRAASLLKLTKLRDVEYRKKLYERGAEAIEKCDDPMILLAKLIDLSARPLRERYEKEFESIEEESYAKIARARFEMHGDKVYPDATFTLRLAFGTMKGYEQSGRNLAPTTTFASAFEVADAHEQRDPYSLPKSWLARKDRLDLDTPYNFVTTHDIIGGNSGSPMFNRKGEIVGLIFDGNIHSLVWDFQFDETRGRALAVHSNAIIEALRKIYDAEALANEIQNARNAPRNAAAQAP
ncbi:MAG TPA: S46 family peptidase [Phycisphaerae bacterium]|nr:S46 family peptidase [Phycisphaerae bacterium]